jgi:hypothetical protein
VNLFGTERTEESDIFIEKIEILKRRIELLEAHMDAMVVAFEGIAAAVGIITDADTPKAL